MPKPIRYPKIWHCVFCGRHWSNGPPEIDGIQCCPYCKEYKGLEPCDPETCDVWVLDVVRKLGNCKDCWFYKERTCNGNPDMAICNSYRGGNPNG